MRYLILAFCAVFFLASCVATGTTPVPQVERPNDSPDQDYRFPITNSGETDVVIGAGQTLWIKIPKGAFNEANKPTTEAMYLDAIKKWQEQQKSEAVSP